jgi:hypothetical protein
MLVVLEADVDVHDAIVMHERRDRLQRTRRGAIGRRIGLSQRRQPGAVRATELVEECRPLPTGDLAGVRG